MKIVSNWGIKFPDKIGNLISADLMFQTGCNAKFGFSNVAGNAEAFNTRLCILAPQVTGMLLHGIYTQ